MEVLRIEQLIQEIQKSLSLIGLAVPGERIGVLEGDIPPFCVHDADALHKLLMILLSEADQEHPVSFRLRNRSRRSMSLAVRSGSDIRTERYRVYIRRLGGELTSDGADTSLAIPCTPLPGGSRQPPISLKAIMQEIGDEETALLIVRQYIDHLKDQIERIRKALQRDDYITAHREAHAIKGGALNIHAPLLAEAAKRLERNAKNGSLELGRTMLEEIARHVAEIESYLRADNRRAKDDAYSPGPLR